MVDNEPPAGLPIKQRLHSPGSLVKLRYQQIDDSGAAVATYEVRALAPPLPAFPPNYCPKPCRDQLQSSGAALIDRSGQAGLADEWLLRMPVGRTFTLGRRSLQIQDIEQKQSRAAPYANYQVTLLDICQAKVRIGKSTSFQFSTDSVVPVPKGFVTRRWVQLEGCRALMQARPPAALSGPVQEWEKPQPHFRTSWPGSMADFEAVQPSQPLGQPEVTLVAAEPWITRHGQPVVFHMLRACHFEPAAARWVVQPAPEGDIEIAPSAPSTPTIRIVHQFPELNALLFAEWVELWPDKTRHEHRFLVPPKQGSCFEKTLPEPAAGQIVACVPVSGNSETMLVPDPERLCGKGTPPKQVVLTPGR
jgi:hypothetical protein